MASRLGGEATAGASYLVLAASAIFGPGYAVRALATSWLISMLSPGLAPEAVAEGIGRYLVLFGAALSVFVHTRTASRRQRTDPFLLGTLALGLFMVVHSWLVSPVVDVSVLKALSWTIAAATSVAAWCSMSPQERHLVSNQIFWGLVAVLLVSLPLAITPLGYLRNGTGFQGVLNHPQALGPTMAILCAWASARLLADANPPWRYLAIAGLSFLAVVISEARTAGLAVVLGTTVAVITGPGLAGRPILSIVPGLRSPRVWAVILVAVVAALVLTATFSELVQHYITKSGRRDVQTIFDAYELSRGRVMDAMLENIRSQPWTGIGFGIDSVPDRMTVSRDAVFGLPLSASIEKGVTPLMVLEELGIFGGVAVGLWVLALLRAAARGGLASYVTVLVVLFINLGEATLFSPGGWGLLPLVLLGYAYASGRRPKRGRHA